MAEVKVIVKKLKFKGISDYVELWECNSCGELKITEENKFCPMCGKELVWED